MFRWIRVKLALMTMHFIKILVDLAVMVGFFCEAVIGYQVLQYVYGLNAATTDTDLKKLVYLLPAIWMIWRSVYWWIITQGQGIRPALLAKLREHVFRLYKII